MTKRLRGPAGTCWDVSHTPRETVKTNRNVTLYLTVSRAGLKRSPQTPQVPAKRIATTRMVRP